MLVQDKIQRIIFMFGRFIEKVVNLNISCSDGALASGEVLMGEGPLHPPESNISANTL
jgi:hypothetical protein